MWMYCALCCSASLLVLASCSSSSSSQILPHWMLDDFDKRSSDSWRLFDKDGSSSEEEVVGKRESPSLSIVNPLDVLRQRLMLEMARRRMEENKNQIRENAILLQTLGKRDAARRRQVSNSDNFED